MTLDKKDRDILVGHKIHRAVELIEEVRFLIDNGKLTTAVNRIYYGMFYAVSALALKSLYSTSKHGQLLGWFNKEYIKTGILEAHYGKKLINSFNKRTKSDYEDFAIFDKDELNELLQDMEDFIKRIQEIINSR